MTDAMGFIFYTRVLLEGFMAFAAMHYAFQWWSSRRERILLAFAAFCAANAVLNHVTATVSSTTAIDTAQSALNLRTTVGLLVYPLLAWIVARITEIEVRRYVAIITILLGGAALVNVLGWPLNGVVTGLRSEVMPWGETMTVIERGPAGPFTSVLFLVLLSVPVFTIGAGWIARRRDGLTGWLVLISGAATLSGVVLSALVDLFRLPMPYVSLLNFAVWIPSISLLLSREYARRGDRLVSSEARYRTLVESAPEAIVVLDIETRRFVDCNRKAVELYGWSRSELLERGPIEISPSHQPDGRLSADIAVGHLQQAIAGAELVFEWIHVDRHGQEIPCEVQLVRLPDPTRVLIRGSMLDIRERKHAELERLRLEEQLRQSQKMEAVGQLAGGIAHDFNNLLTIIQGHTSLLRATMADGDERLGDLEVIGDAAGRAAALTQRLMTFSRRAVVASKVVDLNDVVRESEQILRRLIGEDIRLAVILDPAAGRVKGDTAHLGQVIINLVLNARDATPAGGLLTLTTSSVQIDEDAAAARGLPAGRYARLTVIDTGTGMTPEVRTHIFEPFFTTKEVGKGTGLGLAVVHGIVKQGGGSIDIDTAPGRGTTVRVDLPAVEEASHAEPDPAPVKASGTETILLVEDEEGVRVLMARTLRQQGFEVLTTANGTEAIQIAQSHGRAPDLLVTDVVMPGMTGRELADTLREQYPTLKVLFVSGYTDDALLKRGVMEAREALLAKPFLPRELGARVRQILDEARPLDRPA